MTVAQTRSSHRCTQTPQDRTGQGKMLCWQQACDDATALMKIRFAHRCAVTSAQGIPHC